MPRNKSNNLLEHFIKRNDSLSTSEQNPEGDIIDRDKDVDGIDSQATLTSNASNQSQPITSTSDSSCASNPGPWPYISKYFKHVSRKEDSDTLNFLCQMCLPVKKMFSCTEKSRNGLKSHYKHMHTFCFNEFKNCMAEGSKASRSKKRPIEQQERTVECQKKRKELVQPTLTANLAARAI